MNHNKFNVIIALCFGLILALGSSAYVVGERQIAVITQFSRLVATDEKAGLKFKIPLIQSVEFFDARIQSINADPERFLTSEKKSLIVDYFVEWRIKDIRTFYTSVQGNFEQASTLLDNMVKERLRAEFVQRTVKEAISEERGAIMADATNRLSQEAQRRYGIEVLGVRLKRVDFSDENRDQVFARMRAERERVSKDFRARGREKADVIRANAEREAAELLAKAREEADIMRGETDANAAKLYAASYGADLEFYRFQQSLRAYRNSLTGSTLIVSPEGQFFRYLNNGVTLPAEELEGADVQKNKPASTPANATEGADVQENKPAPAPANATEGADVQENKPAPAPANAPEGADVQENKLAPAPANATEGADVQENKLAPAPANATEGADVQENKLAPAPANAPEGVDVQENKPAPVPANSISPL